MSVEEQAVKTSGGKATGAGLRGQSAGKLRGHGPFGNKKHGVCEAARHVTFRHVGPGQRRRQGRFPRARIADQRDTTRLFRRSYDLGQLRHRLVESGEPFHLARDFSSRPRLLFDPRITRHVAGKI